MCFFLLGPYNMMCSKIGEENELRHREKVCVETKWKKGLDGGDVQRVNAHWMLGHLWCEWVAPNRSLWDHGSVAPMVHPMAHWKGSGARCSAPFSSLLMMDERREGGMVRKSGAMLSARELLWVLGMVVMGGNGNAHRWGQRWVQGYRSAFIHTFWLSADAQTERQSVETNGADI